METFGGWKEDGTREPRYGKCEECGARVDLDGYDYMGAVQCPKCGQWYNLNGEELLPPDQWGEVDEDY